MNKSGDLLQVTSPFCCVWPFVEPRGKDRHVSVLKRGELIMLVATHPSGMFLVIVPGSRVGWVYRGAFAST